MKKYIPGRFIFAISGFLKNNLPVLGWSLSFLLIAGALHFYVSDPLDGDTPYHAAVGQLIWKHGILHEFPWTPFSWLSDHYADDKLLFHLMFVPFAGLNWITAARIVGTLAGAAMLVALYLVLRTERVRYAGLWALIPLAGSVLFIVRFMQTRPHLLSITLALIFLWASARGRLKILAAVSVIYPWAYIAFWQIPGLLLIASEAARLLAGKQIRWKPAAVVLAGIVGGVAVHPNAANLLEYNWVVMSEVLFKSSWLERAGFDMGTELQPYPLGGWVQGLIINVGMTVAAAIYAWRNRREDIVPLAFTLAALGFCALTVRSVRFAEYYVPFSVGALALASRSIRWRFLGPAILGVSTVYTMLVGYPSLSGISKMPNKMPPRIASFFQKQIPPGSLVFTTSWDYTSLLLVTLPDRYFLVALDPTLFYLKDPELYRLWYRLAHEAPPGIAETIRWRFGARYVLVFRPKLTAQFNYQLSSEPGVRILLHSDLWMFFDLGAPSLTKNPVGHE